jgi:glycosyltransferase involved in cell wall biosynthesis
MSWIEKFVYIAMMRTALLLVGSIGQPGGMGMRWRALYEALDGPTGCRLYEIACDRTTLCRDRCLATGTAHRRPGHRGSYFDRPFCRTRLDGLVERMAADGVTTVVCSGLNTYRYVTGLAGRSGARVVYDMHNAELPLYRAINAAMLAGAAGTVQYGLTPLDLVEFAERAALTAADEIWACSERDLADIAELYPQAAGRPARVVPNVVTLPPPPADAGPAPVPQRVVFTGRMDYYPNLVAARAVVDDLAPALLAAGRTEPVVVCGAAVDEWIPAEGLSPNVRLVSDPPSTAPVLTGGVLMVPLSLGGGSRLKILEGFALRTPVVSSAKGVEGLEVTPEVHYLPAETPAEFVAAVGRVLDDERLRTRLVASAARLVGDRYSMAALRSCLQRHDSDC